MTVSDPGAAQQQGREAAAVRMEQRRAVARNARDRFHSLPEETQRALREDYQAASDEAAAIVRHGQSLRPTQCSWDCTLTGHQHCTSMGCDVPGTVWGTYDDGDTRERVPYCAGCAKLLADGGEFTPDPSPTPPARDSGREGCTCDAPLSSCTPGCPCTSCDALRDSGRDEAREAVARWLVVHYRDASVHCPLAVAQTEADELLALPELVKLLRRPA